MRNSAWAHRPPNSAFSFLDKLELRDDRVTGAVAGVTGPLGTSFTIAGDARSRRIVNSLSVNYSPYGGSADGGYFGRTELSLFWGTRYVSDRVNGDDVTRMEQRGGRRYPLRSRPHGRDRRLGDGAPRPRRQQHRLFGRAERLGIRPFDNGWLQVGWNVVGFHDRDFRRIATRAAAPM